MAKYKYLVISTGEKAEISADSFQEAKKNIFEQHVKQGFFEGKISSIEVFDRYFLILEGADLPSATFSTSLPKSLAEIPSDEQQLETAVARFGFKDKEEALQHAAKIKENEAANFKGGVN